jgi:hypothetical protein
MEPILFACAVQRESASGRARHLQRGYSASALLGVLSAIVLLAAQNASVRAPDYTARAAAPRAIELAEHGLAVAAGPDDEGPYQLIDPLGPGGVSNAAAADEVFSAKLQGGKYGSTANSEPVYP